MLLERTVYSGPMPHSETTHAFRITAPVMLGYLPLGAAFGMLLVAAGFDWWWAPIWAVLLYSGSLQYLAVPMLATGVGLAQIAVTSFFVQFRHVFYRLSFPLHKISPLAARAYGAQALTDEAYALLSPYRAKPATSRFLFTAQLLCHSYWIVGCTVGALLGSSLNLQIEGLDFTLTALFVVLALEAYRTDPDRGTVLAALACGLVARLIWGTEMLVPGLLAFVAILIVRFLANPAKHGRPMNADAEVGDLP